MKKRQRRSRPQAPGPRQLAPASGFRSPASSINYRDAGVDIEGADGWLSRMRPLIRSTLIPGVLPDRGQFAGLFDLSRSGARDPLLVASTDGVGTKLKVAQLFGAHEAIGIDVVAMNTNDILVYGARPLFFLDYLALGKLQRSLMSDLLRGIVRGCKLSGCALLGGETAEMPGVYGDGEYDVAGFCVGLVERSRLIDGSQVRAGDVVVGLASSGVHANGFSLVRRVFAQKELLRRARELLAPTRIYVKPLLQALSSIPIRAIAHVTGGGLARRLPGLVPPAHRSRLSVRLREGSWPIPSIFRAIQEAGSIDKDEMRRTFNMGIGMALVSPASEAQRLIRLMRRAKIDAWVIGDIERN